MHYSQTEETGNDLVPTVSAGTRVWNALRSLGKRRFGLGGPTPERRQEHAHAEHGNEKNRDVAACELLGDGV